MRYKYNPFTGKLDLIQNLSNIRIVKENQTVQQVLDSITDVSANNPYTIIIPPGVYEEQIVMKDYVTLQGCGRNNTIIKANNPSFGWFVGLKLAKNVCLRSLSVIPVGDYEYLTICVESPDEGDFDVYIDDCNLGEEGKGYAGLYFSYGGRFFVTNSRIAVVETSCESFYGEYNLYSCELVKGTLGGMQRSIIVWQSGKGGSIGRLFNCYVHAEDSLPGSIIVAAGAPTTLFEMYNTKVYATSSDVIYGLQLGSEEGTWGKNGIANIYGGSIEVHGADGSKDIVRADTGGTLKLNIYGTKYNTASGIIGGTNRQQGRSIVLSSNTTFSPEDGNVFKLTTDGNDYNFNPTGTFAPWTQITVINADNTNTITFDSTGLNQVINPGQRAIFIYDGNNWDIINLY